jgi:penicillin-binding protein-related factor A (putative recombinase)
MRQKIYLELVVLKPENAVHLTEAEQQAIPCHFLLAQEAEKRMLVIEYTPGSERATRDRIIAVHLRAYSRRYKIISYEVFDDFVPALPAHLMD